MNNTLKRALARLFRLTIAKKLLLGFLSYGILTLLITVIALSSLQRLNEINHRIIERDVRLIQMTDEMIEALLAQELYGRRSFILKSSEMETLFLKRSEEFEKLLRQMGNLPDVSNLPLDRIAALHQEYSHLFKMGWEKREDFSSRAFQEHDRQIRRKQEELFQLVKGISLDAREDQNELGDLFQAFQKMAQRLKRLEEMSLDANPLTHLPGSVAIENVLNKRLKEGAPLAFCQLDLSNFKAFNDRYGYVRGNEVIQATAKMAADVGKAHGVRGAFVGHIGGDDFVVITSPEGYEKICLAVIDSFDKMVLDFYDIEDRQRGCIQGETRQGQKVSFPIMTIGIAVVTNQHRGLQNYVQVGEIAAEMKNYAKSFSRSIFVVDRRKDNGPRQGDGKI